MCAVICLQIRHTLLVCPWATKSIFSDFSIYSSILQVGERNIKRGQTFATGTKQGQLLFSFFLVGIHVVVDAGFTHFSTTTPDTPFCLPDKRNHIRSLRRSTASRNRANASWSYFTPSVGQNSVSRSVSASSGVRLSNRQWYARWRSRLIRWRFHTLCLRLGNFDCGKRWWVSQFVCFTMCLLGWYSPCWAGVCDSRHIVSGAFAFAAQRGKYQFLLLFFILQLAGG